MAETEVKKINGRTLCDGKAREELNKKQPIGNYITEESDPTVPAWAKQPTKPSYTAKEVGARPDTWTPTASDVGADPIGSADKALADAKAYTDKEVANIPTPDVSGQISTHNTNAEAHNDIRLLIAGLTTRLNALADSDDTTLDQMSELVAYIKSNRTLIESVTTDKVNVSDIIDDLETNVSNKPLSAAQGARLYGLIQEIWSADYATTAWVNRILALELENYLHYDGTQGDPPANALLLTGNGTQYLVPYLDGYLIKPYNLPLATEDTLGAMSPEDKVKLNSLSEEIADHENNTTLHVTSAEKQVWNNKLDASALPTIVQEAGESESSVMSQAATTKLVEDALAEAEKVEYETVDSVDEMTDTSKSYVLSSTGTLWAYTEQSVDIENNEYNPDTAKLNYRINSSGSEVAYNGTLLTDYIEVDYASEYMVTIDGISHLTATYDTVLIVDYYDSEKTKIEQKTSGALNLGTTSTNGDTVDTPFAFNLFNVAGLSNTKYVRIRLGIKHGVAITSADCEGLVINFAPKNYTGIVSEWTDTGITPSEGGGAGGNYVTLLAKVNENTSNIAEVSNRVTALETGSETLTIPTFWQTAVDECIAKIKALQVGRNCITFPFFSDNHQRNGYAGMLIAYVMEECNIPYCIYGGDSISNGTIADEAEMIEQDKAFDAIMSYVPNGRLCRAVGNHDGYWYDGTNKYYYTREQVYELFLREESIAQNKYFGDDGTYYYVDDIASKTRFIVLNTNGGSVDSTQISWLQNTALSFNESGWAVVLISHQPLSNHYHALIENAAEVCTAISNAANGVDIVGCFSGHIHRDRIYTGAAVNTSDDTEGDTMPFKQVTITSDHTGIAYDDATKHTVANDDKSHAIDFVTINKTTRTVNITRLGIGEDRSYTY